MALSDTHTTASASETEQVGTALAELLEPGDVVLISGELGSGKTTLVRGAVRALGIDTIVRSPTFTIGSIYRGESLSVAHLDLYRLDSLDGEDPALLDEYLDPSYVAFVEWPQSLGGLELRSSRFEIELRHLGGDRREIVVR